MPESFKKRVAKFWETFVQEESQIREMMDNKAEGETQLSFVDSILQTAFDQIYFEMGINDDGKYELILTPEGDKIKLFELHYWLQYAPKELLDRWNFYSSKPGKSDEGSSLRMYGVDITHSDLTIYPTCDNDRRKIHLEVYAPKLEDLEDGQHYTMFFIYLDQFIGEVYTMEYIGNIDFIEGELDKEVVSISDLKAYIDNIVEKEDWTKVDNPLELYSGYKLKPTEKQNWMLREDIMTGYSSCMPIINHYYNKQAEVLDEAKKDGVTWGFLFFENINFPKETIVASRSEIEDKIVEQTSIAGIADSIGGATGFHFSYIDFIVYDYEAFLKIAKEVLAPYNFEEVGFSEFIYGAQPEWFE